MLILDEEEENIDAASKWLKPPDLPEEPKLEGEEVARDQADYRAQKKQRKAASEKWRSEGGKIVIRRKPDRGVLFVAEWESRQVLQMSSRYFLTEDDCCEVCIRVAIACCADDGPSPDK